MIRKNKNYICIFGCMVVLVSVMLSTSVSAEDKKDGNIEDNFSIDETTKAEIKQSASDIKAQAEQEAPKILDQATIEAGNIVYDKQSKTLTAEDNVVLGYQSREIRAQKVVYDQNTKIIKADNGVKYKDTTGTVFSAEDISVTDKFDKGEMNHVHADFGDGSTFNADNLTIVALNKYNLKDSTYSPCKICIDGKYLWQFDSDKIVYDEGDGRVKYENVYIKIFGHEVFWLPFISHPTPSASSKSGFLSPKFGQSSDFGAFIKIPYYYQPKSDVDFTFTPFLTSKDGPLMIVEHRHLFENGQYLIEVSGIDTRKLDDSGNKIPGGGDEFRGHVKTNGEFKFLEDWKWGWDATRTTDDTYLHRYRIGINEDVLTSQLYTNRIKERDFFSAKAFSFQGLRANDDPSISPYVLPLVDAGKTFAVSDKYDQKIETNFNSLVLKRDVGSDSTRFVGSAKWRADYITSGGQVLNLTLGTRADYYDVNSVPFNSGTFNGNVSRQIPSATLTWSLPMQKVAETYGIVLEPVAMVIGSTIGNNTKKIPNEDSQNIELSDYNLFQENHISGHDIVEDGFRVNYGVRGVVTTKNVGDYNFLFGQNYRSTKDTSILTSDSGLSDNFSDYVGRIITGADKVQTIYRFRLNKDNYQFERNEVGFNFNLNPVNLSSGYTFINGIKPDPDRQEIYSNSTLKLTDNINLNANARRNLANTSDAGWVSAGTGLQYKNECIDVSLEMNREFTRDRDIKPSTDFIFKINLANFGN